MLFNCRLDALGHQVVVEVVYLRGLEFVDVTQRHIKTNEELIDDEILEDNLVEVGHQIRELIQEGHLYLNRNRLVLEVAQFDEE